MSSTMAITYELFELKPAFPRQAAADFPLCYEAMVTTGKFQDVMPNFKVITTHGTSVTGENSSRYPRYNDNWLHVEIPGKKLTAEIVKETIEDWLGTAYQVTIVDSKCSGYYM